MITGEIFELRLGYLPLESVFPNRSSEVNELYEITGNDKCKKR